MGRGAGSDVTQFPAGNSGNWMGELSLDEELRQQLGLAASDGLRVLKSSGRFILLERCGDHDSPLAVPWDRSLVLSADVRSFPLADILSMIHSSGKSGFLAFDDSPAQGGETRASDAKDDKDKSESAECASGNVEKAIYFRHGEVVFAASTDPADRLGHSLLRAGKLTLAELRDSQQAWSGPERFGKVLVERGLLSPRELWNAVKHQVEEIVRSLFAHTHGQVYFWEGDVQPDNVVRLVLPTRRLVGEGLRRRDEIFRFLAMLEEGRIVLTPVPEEGGRLTGNERVLYEELLQAAEFGPACRRAGVDPLTGARVVQLLALVGALRTERTGADPVAHTNEDDSVRELVRDHVKLLAELVAPLVAVDGSERVSEMIAAIVLDGSEQFPELFEDLVIGAGAVLDPEELVARSLRLAGDRRAQVAQALGELVAYVEFELMNHPEIADPQVFLDALESLRASIR